MDNALRACPICRTVRVNRGQLRFTIVGKFWGILRISDQMDFVLYVYALFFMFFICIGLIKRRGARERELDIDKFKMDTEFDNFLVRTETNSQNRIQQVTYFIVPSAIWPRTDEEKHEIIDGYKVCFTLSVGFSQISEFPSNFDKIGLLLLSTSSTQGRLKSIDCKHYDYGRGTCPFGTSCFYRHADENGVEDSGPALRKAIGSDGESLQVLQQVRLSDFLTTATAQRAFRRR